MGLWLVVSVSTTDYTEDRMALEVLTKAVSPELMGTIANKATAKAACDSMYLWNIGVERVRKERASMLRREFDMLKFEDDETIDNFGVCINSLITQLALLGTGYTDKEILRRFLQALPPRYDQTAASIETLLDLGDISLDELIGRLKPVEEKMNRSDKESVARLNLTEDELVAHVSSRLKVVGSGNKDSSMEGSSSGKRRRRRGRGHGRNNGSHGGTEGGGRASNGGGRGNGGGGVAGDECRYYKKKGH
jgi:uncharacterized membrane protein YgcG